jgi:hydrogenase/urease accessory protein HupE
MTTMAPTTTAAPTGTPTAVPLVEGRERKGLSAVEIGVITVAIAISIVLIGIILALQRPLA